MSALTFIAALGDPAAPQRQLYVAGDGAFVLKEGERFLATARREVVEDLAIAICCGDTRTTTQPGALLALATFILALAVRHETDPASPGRQGVTGRHPSEPTPPAVPPGSAPAATHAVAEQIGQGGGAAPDLFTIQSCPACGQ